MTVYNRLGNNIRVVRISAEQPDFLAAKLFYKMLTYKFKGEEVDDDYDNTYDTDLKSVSNTHFKFDDDED